MSSKVVIAASTLMLLMATPGISLAASPGAGTGGGAQMRGSERSREMLREGEKGTTKDPLKTQDQPRDRDQLKEQDKDKTQDQLKEQDRDRLNK